jgi:hypothetical protein
MRLLEKQIPFVQRFQPAQENSACFDPAASKCCHCLSRAVFGWTTVDMLVTTCDPAGQDPPEFVQYMLSVPEAPGFRQL